MSNLPHEPEFEQAYNGMQQQFFLREAEEKKLII